MRKVDAKKVNELCVAVIVEKVSGIKTAEKREGIYNYTWIGNDNFYIETEESIIDFSCTLRAFIGKVCIFEEVLEEGADVYAMSSAYWTAFYALFIDILFDRIMSMFEFFSVRQASTKEIMGDINWSSFLYGLCQYLKDKNYNEEAVDKIDDMAFASLFNDYKSKE